MVAALFHHLALVHDHDPIGLEHGGQTVGDNQGGTAYHGLFQGLLDETLILRIQGTGGLVQQQDGRIADQGPGNGQTLALAALEASGPFPQRRGKTLGQGIEEGLGLGRSSHFPHLSL